MKLPTTIQRALLLSLLVTFVALPLLCAGTFLWEFYLQPDPVSPPPTGVRADAGFDAQLASLAREWKLLFRHDNQIILTDGDGQNPTLLLDLADATGDPDSTNLGHEAISPHGLRLAVNHYSGREPDSGQPISQAMIVDIQDGSIRELSIPADDYRHDWTTGAYWLNDDLLLVKTHRYTGEDMFSEQERFILFDARNASPLASFEFPPCPLFHVLSEATESLLLASDCAPSDQREVWAIDSSGKRHASPAEVALFDERELDRYPPLSVYQHPSSLFRLITIEPLWAGPEGFGRFYERNWNRDFLYLGEDLVRTSDVFIRFEPEWQSGLELFIWTEEEHTYIMDPEGHYRHLFSGVYLGRIPARE